MRWGRRHPAGDAGHQPDGKAAPAPGACDASKDAAAASYGAPEQHQQGATPRLSPRPGLLSLVLFLFIAPVVRHARRAGDVQAAQLFFPKAVLIERVHGLFAAAWTASVAAGRPSIVRAVVANSFWGLIWTGALYAISLAAQLVGPMVLQRIVAGLQCWGAAGGQHTAAAAQTCPTEAHLYYYVIAISLAPLVQSLAENQMQYQLNVIGLKMRNGLMAAIYRKCLRLSNAALQSESTGRVVTLMSNDAQKVQDVTLAIHTLWGAPVLIVAILALLYQQMGWATFVGLLVVVAFSPVSTKVSARMIRLRRALMVWTDKRVGLMNEVINSMQMIKFMAWERPFEASVLEVRAKEAGILRSLIWWQSLFAMLLFSGPVLMAVLVFAVYAVTGHVFGPAGAYTSLALFNLLRMPLAFLPLMITACINALVALNRISDFLRKPESGLDKLRAAAAATAPGRVVVQDGTFSWDTPADDDDSSTATAAAAASLSAGDAPPSAAAASAAAPVAASLSPSSTASSEASGSSSSSISGTGSSFLLRDVTFEARPGTLTLVVGSVASGKSSLLSALIGQMEGVAGSVAVGGGVAYVAQTAWIINDSVQENIVMGEAFEPSRYALAASAAQLLPDLELWRDGDATEIGDRGVTLSGGQKARVSIARAVYADADTYLLDDPLAAVDSHVGRALFEGCIRGLLRHKTVILVTNALQFMPAADNIIWLDQGRVRAQGKYQDLVAAGFNVSELHLEHEEHEEEGEEDDGARSADSSSVAGSEDWEQGAGADDADAAAAAAAGAAAGLLAAREQPAAASVASSVASSGRGPGGVDSDCHSSGSHAVRVAVQPAGGAAVHHHVEPEQQQHGSPGGDDLLARGGGVAAADTSPSAAARVLVSHALKPHDSAAGLRSRSSDKQQQQQQRHGGSVAEAALALAASKQPPPPHLTMHRLAAEEHRNLTGVEEKEKGGISGTVLWAYVAAAGGLLVALSVVAVMALEQGSRVATDTFLGFWASDRFHRDVWFYVGIYAGLGIFYSLMTFVRVCWFMWTTVNASVSLHNRLLSHILRLPKLFFDTNPAGRVLNRFSRDVETMDSVLNQSMVQCCNCFATYIAILIVISVATRWFAVSVLPITAIYVIVQRFYIPSARELQRLESVTRSPIYSKFSEALAGVATIRAYRREAYFTAASDSLMELNAAAFVSQRAAAAWLAVRLDLLGVLVVTLTAVLSISGGISPALAGLCLVYALDMTRFLKYGTALAAKTESDFNSVERVVQYLLPPTEAAEDTTPDILQQLPPDWPARGAVAVRGLELRYRAGLPLVLRGLTFDVPGGAKVGLVGRTGSGKSSLLLALFRMVEPEAGSILIDGVDISTLGLAHLRSKMSIIPQEPFLFSGTVRSNLDPFGAYAEGDLWRALAAVGLKGPIAALQHGLDARVVDGGNNFSQGQKQLFCLARAILRNSRLLMLDEATASVDPDTDALIQATIRSSFAATTMLTIAHRLNTIMDADHVLVLDQGRLAEAGEPHELLQANQGIFTGMVAQTGPASSAHLRDVARQASITRAASRTALRLHQLRDGLQRATPAGGAASAASPSAPADVTRVESEVLGRRYSTFGLSRYGCQDPMAACLAPAGSAYVREMSLLQRNADGGGTARQAQLHHHSHHHHRSMQQQQPGGLASWLRRLVAGTSSADAAAGASGGGGPAATQGGGAQDRLAPQQQQQRQQQ